MGRWFQHEGEAEEVTLQAHSQGQRFTALPERQPWDHEHGYDHLPLNSLHILAVTGCYWQAQEKRERPRQVVPAFLGSTMESLLPCYLELRAALLQTSCYACFQVGLTIVSSLCDGLGAEEAGGRARPSLARCAAGQLTGKRAVFSL